LLVRANAATEPFGSKSIGSIDTGFVKFAASPAILRRQ
jgi:hypothetical protein